MIVSGYCYNWAEMKDALGAFSAIPSPLYNKKCASATDLAALQRLAIIGDIFILSSARVPAVLIENIPILG